MEELLKPSQLQAIVSLSQGATIQEAAKAANVHPKSIDNWLRKSEFRSELTRVITNRYRQNLGRLDGLVAKGITRLEAILDDPDTEAAIVIRSLNLLLRAGEGFQTLHINDEISAIREQLENES